MTSGESLMERFRDRLDTEAFDEIVSRFTNPALMTAVQILSDRAMAEDAVQETFLRMVRGRRGYKPAKPLSSWFYTILRNVCTDMLRRRARQSGLVENAALHTVAASRAPWDGLDMPELLAKLPADDRAVLTLRIVHGLAFADIAASLGISREAAKKRAQRALRRLRGDARILRWYRDGWDGGRVPGSPGYGYERRTGRSR